MIVCKRINMEPELVDKKAFDSPLPESVFQNSLAVIGLISNKYSEGPEWVMNFRLARREDDCLAIEWPKESVYCCIYSDSIAVDRTTLLSDSQVVTHNEQEFQVLGPDSITNDFIRHFEMVWR